MNCIAMLLALAALSPALADAKATANSASEDLQMTLSTGLGYDSNAYQAPRSAYVDYAALPVGSNPYVVPNKKAGFFVPYAFVLDAEKNIDARAKLIGSAAADGSYYSGPDLGNAKEYNFRVRGGSEYVLASEGHSENTVYVGAIAGKHRQIYVDHDSGLNKVSTLSGSDISNRYSYTSIGVEAKYKNRTGRIDYGVGGQYLKNDYANPVVVSQLDHTYYKLGADVSIPIAAKTRLNLSYDHTVRDYSSRHTHDAAGVYKSAYPLLQYKYDAVGITLRKKIMQDWLLYLDYDRTQRADNFVSYNDYKENRYGFRVLYEQGTFKSRLSLHHWGRDYANGYAYDVQGQGPKTYSGNVLKIKAELEQSKHSSLWTDLEYKSQTSTDLRYDYVRSQIMAGMSWAY